MSWFGFARKEGFPTQYPPNATPVTVDVVEAAVVTAFVLLAFCFLAALPSIRWRKNAYLFVRITVSLAIGLCILLVNFGQEWEVGDVATTSAYRAGTGAAIHAHIGLKIGLRGINVTLKGKALEEEGPLGKEAIDYNERYEWTWDQGRFGFGPEAGRLQRQFRASQRRGAPLPILWTVDHFAIDGEGFRFGRFYRTAGWYVHVAVWTAFASWLVSLLLFRSVIRYGGRFLGLTGGLLLAGNVVWTCVRNPVELAIPFEDGTMRVRYGGTYWLCLVTGLACVVLSAVVVFLDANFDVAVSIFFGVDPLRCFDEYILTQRELEVLRDKTDDIGMAELQAGRSVAEEEEEVEMLQTVLLKRKTTMRVVGSAPIRVRKLKAARSKEVDDQPLYGNVSAIKRHEKRGGQPPV